MRRPFATWRKGATSRTCIYDKSERRLRSFARQLLRAFVAADSYASERLGVRSRDGMHSSRDSGSVALYSRSKSMRGTLLRVHEYCVSDSIASLCKVLHAPEDSEDRVTIALGEEGQSNADIKEIAVDLQELLQCLTRIECSLYDISRSLTRSKSNRAWVADYQPDWRIRNLIWDLVKSFGKINPPEECVGGFRRIKEATFTALFKGNYLLEQRERAEFRSTLLRHIPRPNAWDANMSWLAVAFFISVPVASVAHTFRSDNRLGAFWGTFFIIFICTAVGCVLFYAKYSSHYATKLLDKAAADISRDSQLNEILEDDNSDSESYTATISKYRSMHDEESKTARSQFGVSSTCGNPKDREEGEESEVGDSDSPDTITNISTGSSLDQDRECKEQDSATLQQDPSADKASESEVSPTVNLANNEVRVRFEEPRRRPHEDVSNVDIANGGLLRLYQVTMLVERLFGSSYFDDQWAIGLSEDRLYDAIVQILTSDSALGRQFAAFSFTAVAISSKGTSLGPGSEAVAASGVRFSFGLFGLLAASGFLCGLTSSILADFMLRKIHLTQTKDDKTSHEFADEFGFYLRMNGGLNGFAGMFLATAIFHFLLSIFGVSPAAAIPLAAIWLLGGSVLMESFLASFAFWSLNEVFEDLGEFVESPDLQSPSPVTGTIQILYRSFRKALGYESAKED